MAHDEAIQRALELIKAGNKEEARSVLQDLLRQDRDNLAGWQGMARLAKDKKEAIFCLRQILRLKPGDAWASQQLDKLEGKEAEPAPPPEPALPEPPEPAVPEPSDDFGLPPLMRSEEAADSGLPDFMRATLPAEDSGLPDFMRSAPPADESGLPPLMRSEPPAEDSGLPDFMRSAPPADESGLPPLMRSEPPAEDSGLPDFMRSAPPVDESGLPDFMRSEPPAKDSGLPDFMRATPPAEDSGLPPLMRSEGAADSGLPDFMRSEPPADDFGLPPLMKTEEPHEGLSAFPPLMSSDAPTQASSQNRTHPTPMEALPSISDEDDWADARAGTVEETPVGEEEDAGLPGEDWREALYEKPVEEPEPKRGRRRKKRDRSAPEEAVEGEEKGVSGWLIGGLLLILLCVILGMTYALFLKDQLTFNMDSYNLPTAGSAAEIDDMHTTTYTGNISLGQSQTQTLDGAFDAHSWMFAGSAGQSITVSVRGSDNMDPEVSVYDPGGNELGLDDDSGGGSNGHDALLTVTLPADGTYVIRVRPWQTGTYTISVN